MGHRSWSWAVHREELKGGGGKSIMIFHDGKRRGETHIHFD